MSHAPSSPMRAVVLGIGNLLLSDDGVGVRAIERFGERWRVPDGVEVIDGGTSGMELLDALSRLDLLVVADAVNAGRAPGEMVVIEGDAVPRFFRSKLSPHQVGLADVLANLELIGEAPRRTVIVGVQPETLATRMRLSDGVAARVDDVVQTIADKLVEHGIAPQRILALAA